MLQVTTATTLMVRSVDEQLIMDRTGHRSLTAVRTYKRPTSEVQKEVSDLLQPPPPKKMAAGNTKVGVDSDTCGVTPQKTPTCTITSSASLGDSVKVQTQVDAPVDIVTRNLTDDSNGKAIAKVNVNSNDGDANVSVPAGDTDQEDIVIKVLKGDNMVEIKL